MCEVEQESCRAMLVIIIGWKIFIKKIADFSVGFICASNTSLVLPRMLAFLQLFVTTKPPKCLFDSPPAAYLPPQLWPPPSFLSIFQNPLLSFHAELWKRLNVRTKSHRRSPEQYCCCVCALFQGEARMPAVPLHHSPHAGAGPGAASQRYTQGAADTLSLLRHCKGVAADEQTLPPVHRCLRGCLSFAGWR